LQDECSATIKESHEEDRNCESKSAPIGCAFRPLLKQLLLPLSPAGRARSRRAKK
jgi:hypothetical protein